jgi:hypothetical protein
MSLFQFSLIALLLLQIYYVQSLPSNSRNINLITKRQDDYWFSCGRYMVKLPDEEDQEVVGEGNSGLLIKTEAAISSTGSPETVVLKIGNGDVDIIHGNNIAKERLNGNPNGLHVLVRCLCHQTD